MGWKYVGTDICETPSMCYSRNIAARELVLPAAESLFERSMLESKLRHWPPGTIQNTDRAAFFLNGLISLLPL